MKHVSVVILNWNGKHWLEAFLPSVSSSTYPQLDIIVIDNASTDDSVEFLHSTYPAVKVYIWDQNYGFTEGYNKVLPYLDTPYFVLLNSDVEVRENWIEPLVNLMESDANIIAVQPKILSYHEKHLFEYAGAAGGFIDKFAYPFCRGRLFDELEEDKGQYELPLEVFWASGACSMLRTSLVRKIGLFESRFFAHMEEIDFCWRAHNLGYKVMCEPKSVVYHVGGGTLPQSSPRKTFLNVRNSLSMMYMNLPSSHLFGRIMARLLLDGVWSIKLLTEGNVKGVGAIIKGHVQFYAQLGYWHKRRKEIYQSVKPTFIHSGIYPKSIVWAFFVKGKRSWNALFGN